MTTLDADSPGAARDVGQQRPARELQKLRDEPALDGIRGLGAILVFLIHLSMIVIPEQRSMPTVVTGAYIYMDVFFVVSGFLITSILIGEQSKTVLHRVAARGGVPAPDRRTSPGSPPRPRRAPSSSP